MKIEFNDTIPIFLQIMTLIKMQVISGSIKPGDKLLSVREYSKVLEVNPNTVQHAYQELEREGFAFTQRGMGSYITKDKSVVNKAKRQMAEEKIDNFVNGMRGLGFSDQEIVDFIKDYMKKGGE